ncbi:MAG: carbohydrate binding domain-containing protein [Paludibacter sp.]|nr:carbohydrate binding domain-containing protein [Paludibacter sp.]
MKTKTFIFSLLVCVCCVQNTVAQTHHINVDIKKPLYSVQKTMYGIFFEDINYGADGGLYAEMVKNRSFEFPQHLLGWTTFGNVEVRTDNARFARNPHYVRLSSPGHKEKRTGLDNEGFFGISLQSASEYRFSLWAKTQQGKSAIRVELIDRESNVLTFQKISIDSKEWKKYAIILKAPSTVANARLRIFLDSSESVDLEHISLFPVDTWKGRENGLRRDLAQALADLHPGVFRFPGGCIVEGVNLETRYQWKNSVGEVENRPLNENRWEYTFPHRFFPDYFQSYGLGFYEFFVLSEDIGAEPLPVINCGLACQYQNWENAQAHVAVSDLEPYIQDALDLIEFANGDESTTWGKLRAEMGHPAAFNLKFLAVGNEQWGKFYAERLEVFVKALREKHPEIKIIGSAGPSPDGKEFDYGWAEMKRLKADLVDEHYYKNPAWFLANANRYDNYDRRMPKIFAGEYACHVPNRKNNFEAALSEAAFMTGLERNADIVQMCTYAPLFAHIEGWQWRPDLIWFDNLRSVRSVNWYVQQLYATHAGTHVLKTTENKLAISGADSLYASSVIDKEKNAVYLKIVNASTQKLKVRYTLLGFAKGEHNFTHTLLHADNLDAENTLDKPFTVVPQSAQYTFSDNILEIELKSQSFNVFEIKL